MKLLETQRLYFRPFHAQDLETFYAYAKNPNVGFDAGWKPHENWEKSKEVLDSFIENPAVMGVIDRETDRLIGSVGIHDDPLRKKMPGSKKLGYALDEAFWGKGYMTEAILGLLPYIFETLDCTVLSASHHLTNDRARRVIEKSGFFREGTARKVIHRYDGSYLDADFYSLTRREYYLAKAKKLGYSLVLPEQRMEKAYRAYLAYWEKEPRIVPAAGDLKGDSYGEWFQRNKRNRTTPRPEHVPATSFFLVDREGAICGMTDIRHRLNEGLLNFGGHIGYGIRPDLWRQGLGAMLLTLSLQKCHQMGIREALVICQESNLASAKVIEKNDGKYENSLIDETGAVNRRYWCETFDRVAAD